MVYNTPPRHTTNTRGVVLSIMDEFLNNRAIRKQFDGVKVVRISTGHGDTVGMAEAYRRGVEALLDVEDGLSPEG